MNNMVDNTAGFFDRQKEAGGKDSLCFESPTPPNTPSCYAEAMKPSAALSGDFVALDTTQVIPTSGTVYAASLPSNDKPGLITKLPTPSTLDAGFTSSPHSIIDTLYSFGLFRYVFTLTYHRIFQPIAVINY